MGVNYPSTQSGQRGKNNPRLHLFAVDKQPPISRGLTVAFYSPARRPMLCCPHGII